VLVFVSGGRIVPHCTNLAILFMHWIVEGGKLHHFNRSCTCNTFACWPQC